ncbi:MAG: IS66 family transposase [Armatimonadota bacterium]
MTRSELIVEREQLLSRTQHMEARIQELETQNRWLLEQIKLAKHHRFGSSSENVAIQSEFVFNEAEATLDSAPEVVETETVTRVKKRKQPGHREDILRDLPTETIEYRIPEEEQVCKQCGNPMHEMSTECREQIEIIPAQVKLIRHVRYVYGCRHCDHSGESVPIVVADAPKGLIPKSLASPSAVAYIMSEKFVEAMPLYRQEKHFERMGIELPRQNLSNWMLKGGEMLEPLYDRMHELLLELDILHADETTLQVLNEPGRSAQSKSYMWLYRSGRYGPPIICYDYKEGRDGKYAARFLPAFSGYLQVDGHAGYHDVTDATLVGCWSHARRKFVDALVTVPKESRKDPSLLSNIAIRKIKELFKIEREFRDATPEERLAARVERSKPIVDDFKEWLDSESKLALPKSTLGKAFTYSRNQWPKLIRFLSDGRLEIDNNRAERSIKPLVIGRKNWLFANTPRGARMSAIIYSIVETAKENGLNPFDYLKFVFERIKTIDPADPSTIDPLMPWDQNVQAALRIRPPHTPAYTLTS